MMVVLIDNLIQMRITRKVSQRGTDMKLAYRHACMVLPVIGMSVWYCLL